MFNHLDINGTGYQNQQSEEGEPVPKGETEKLLDLLFSTLNSKLQKLCNLPVAEIDGMELLGILAVLQQYLTDHFKPKAPSLDALPVISNDETDKDRERERDLSVKAEEPSTYLVVMLQELRVSLLAKLQIYIADQIAWILAQKSDPKKSGVLVPVAKFPSFVRQVLEMTGGQVRGKDRGLQYFSVSHLQASMSTCICLFLCICNCPFICISTIASCPFLHFNH